MRTAAAAARLVSLVLAALALAGAARAEILDSQANGFTVRETRLVAAPPERVWATLLRPALWWSPAHTFSNDSANLTLDARPGGDWVENLPGGGVRHLTVVFLKPMKLLRLEGALGPLQELGVTGHLTVTLEPQADGVRVTLLYDAGGHAQGSLGDRFAAPVNAVLDEQLGRLKTAAETGRTP